MNRDYPIECKCSHRQQHLQQTFTRQVQQMLPQNAEIAFEPSADGLKLLAETEMALQRPIEILREVYGDALNIEPPAIRYQSGERVEEPYMGLRVQCASRYYEAVRQDLQSRGAVITDAEVGSHIGIVRASARLATLVGYPQVVDQLTSGRAQLVMWLSHYAPLENTT